MKVSCTCGNLILDSSDFLSCKATLIADQDREDLIGELEAQSPDPWQSLRKFEAATVYQCHACGCLHIFRKGKWTSYASESGPTNVLHSNFEDDWRRPLIGHWRKTTGELFWGANATTDGDSGYIANIATWNELESSYQKVFRRLQSQGRLRSAMLTRDGETVHLWPA